MYIEVAGSGTGFEPNELVNSQASAILPQTAAVGIRATVAIDLKTYQRSTSTTAHYDDIIPGAGIGHTRSAHATPPNPPHHSLFLPPLRHLSPYTTNPNPSREDRQGQRYADHEPEYRCVIRRECIGCNEP
ncbi:hypothetical protein G7K_5682-t1 [Saitoella complicata NRRL Y-17804]|uniref:Uncharacterized protein n=1 Tax=Saitoella complicata (strain BCRC 22490 / CBS 7301 / JCM 7358 / NBRC 10748 / NRRL Y-17804) TaxID=698492 RepID=A0A0E9NP54_SAICN|nr:hypothetical protein G7K_5682-t1 [Saitoella complicata NRRL Y-17804]